MKDRRYDWAEAAATVPTLVNKAFRRAAFEERVKIHDLVLEAIGLALRKRGWRK